MKMFRQRRCMNSCFKNINLVGINKVVYRKQKLEVVYWRTEETGQARGNRSCNREEIVVTESSMGLNGSGRVKERNQTCSEEDQVLK